eukprot:CAMPEP_0184694186 /NCGR_PEP_ID=MMETSP0313-20130426/2228_1 /TAXON_ID=2792 /ORGANISM="Porphyridium aerugineum, Strain SAG 1380-2" /LENGTH=829 /DNA_ID=CAMNT_0027152437 /DNA_START=127 /DNA_END=2616 /DNA_ORIENTATION=+
MAQTAQEMQVLRELYRALIRTARDIDKSPRAKAFISANYKRLPATEEGMTAFIESKYNRKFLLSQQEQLYMSFLESPRLTRSDVTTVIYDLFASRFCTAGIYYLPQTSCVQLVKQAFQSRPLLPASAQLESSADSSSTLTHFESPMFLQASVDAGFVALRKLSEAVSLSKSLHEAESLIQGTPGGHIHLLRAKHEVLSSQKDIPSDGVRKLYPVDIQNLSPGTILIAHPLLGGPFERTIILITKYDKAKGASGVVINGGQVGHVRVRDLYSKRVHIHGSANNFETTQLAGSNNAIDPEATMDTEFSKSGVQDRILYSRRTQAPRRTARAKKDHKKTSSNQYLKRSSNENQSFSPVNWGGPVNDPFLPLSDWNEHVRHSSHARNEVTVLHRYDLPGASKVTEGVYLGCDSFRKRLSRKRHDVNCIRDLEKNVIVIGGESVWEPGQLERELAENVWFLAQGPGIADLVFDQLATGSMDDEAETRVKVQERNDVGMDNTAVSQVFTEEEKQEEIERILKVEASNKKIRAALQNSAKVMRRTGLVSRDPIFRAASASALAKQYSMSEVFVGQGAQGMVADKRPANERNEGHQRDHGFTAPVVEDSLMPSIAGEKEDTLLAATRTTDAIDQNISDIVGNVTAAYLNHESRADRSRGWSRFSGSDFDTEKVMAPIGPRNQESNENPSDAADDKHRFLIQGIMDGSDLLTGDGRGGGIPDNEEHDYTGFSEGHDSDDIDFDDTDEHDDDGMDSSDDDDEHNDDDDDDNDDDDDDMDLFIDDNDDVGEDGEEYGEFGEDDAVVQGTDTSLWSMALQSLGGEYDELSSLPLVNRKRDA